MNHKYYQPTEHEQQMVAAGWITQEDADPDYQVYLKNAPYDSEGSYQEWITMKREWDVLNTQYLTEIQPLIDNGDNLSASQSRRETELLREMSNLEILLGY